MQHKIILKREMFRFSCEQDWVNSAQYKFAECGVSKHNYICLDSDGNVCRCGKQFMKATANETYPIIAYELN